MLARLHYSRQACLRLFHKGALHASMQACLTLIRAALLAKGEEVLVGVFDGDRLFKHPRAPFIFEVVHVPARGETARIFMRVGRKAQGRERQGQGALVGFLLRPDDHNFFFDHEGIIGHVIMLAIIVDDFSKQAAKLLHCRAGTAFVAQELKADLPHRLRPAMLARDLIEAALKGFAQEEVLPVERQNIVVLNRIEHPIGKRDLDIKHAPVACLSDDLKGADKPEGA